jgi:hypothetical protein
VVELPYLTQEALIKGCCIGLDAHKDVTGLAVPDDRNIRSGYKAAAITAAVITLIL